ncbi:MAG: hypothetical protein M3Q95_07055 [Bacteroidota bacterium]|nr:hypothetical protein [Bacteroidota bacterium]
MKYIFRIIILITALNFPLTHSFSQVVYQHVDYASIYEFLDEMANIKIIELNSAIKPYSRIYIAAHLETINSRIDRLNKRQAKELAFFMKEYAREMDDSLQIDYIGKKYVGKNRQPFNERTRRPNLFYYRDSTFMLAFNPVLGGQFWNNDSGTVYHRWNGAEMLFYAGNHLGVYGNLRDNYLSKAVTGPEILTRQTGGSFKNPTYGYSNRDAVEYSEMRGGITVNGNWWNLGIVKDHVVWGNNYNGANIISNRAPSFAQVRLNIKPVHWFELNYFHGWLSSKVADSSATQNYGTGTTTVFVPKYMAANFITVKPVRNLFFSVGNSIVYSRTINAGYLIPFMFYKSLDHTYSTLGNSQLFFDLSVRNLKHCHFYASGFFDELSFGRMFEKNSLNPWSLKGGVRISNILKNFSVTAEYTRNNVLAYKHYNPETTFETTRYNMGHHLRDNAQDLFFMVSCRPIAKLGIDVIYNYSNKGPDYPDNRNEVDPVTGEDLILTYPFQEKIIWEKTVFALQGQYELVNDFVFRLRLEMSDVRDDMNLYTPSRFQGEQFTTSATLTFGF